MNRPSEQQSATVPRSVGAKQAEESHGTSRWAWVEPSVWTARMLQALEQRVKGGNWFSLIDKVYKRGNLWSSWSNVASNKGAAGVDHVTVKQYERHVEKHIEHLAEELKTGTYRPKAIRRCYIPKPGSAQGRPLGIPTVQDRVVQGALRHVLEPIFEKGFHEHSYGFRPGRGCKDALRRVQELLDEEYRYVVDADLKSYFDTIPHQPLLERVSQKVADGRVLKLIESFLTQGVLEGLDEWTPASGAPQGAVLSPHAEQRLSGPAGPSDGPARIPDGALRGRLCDPVSKSRGGRTGIGRGATMDGASRSDAASREDTDR